MSLLGTSDNHWWRVLCSKTGPFALPNYVPRFTWACNIIRMGIHTNTCIHTNTIIKAMLWKHAYAIRRSIRLNVMLMFCYSWHDAKHNIEGIICIRALTFSLVTARNNYCGTRKKYLSDFEASHCTCVCRPMQAYVLCMHACSMHMFYAYMYVCIN